MSVTSSDIIVRWPTPVSDLADFRLVSLHQEGRTLVLELEGRRDAVTERWTMTFAEQRGYRNLLEEYRTALWAHWPSPSTGNTVEVRDSSWIARLREEASFEAYLGARARHFMILTGDDVLDVIAAVEPSVERCEAADATGS